MRIPTILAALAAAPTHAFIGYGINMYAPVCATACRSSIESAMLSCSDMDHGELSHSDMHAGGVTTPECRAGDTAFLTTLAWCMHGNCKDSERVWKLEKYWANKATGDPGVPPKWTYVEAVAEVERVGAPKGELGEDNMLMSAVVVSNETWGAYVNTLEHFEYAETLHSRYGIVLLVAGFATPIVVTLLGHLPYMTGVLDRLRPYVVYPSIIGTYHVRALPYNLGNVPTVGQGLYIAMFLALNIVLTAVGYGARQPNMWFATDYQEIMGYVSSRTGVLAFALAPLVILFSGRNNFLLLWATDWSHSTYLLLHRWVARIFGVQVILHSITELVLYIDMGEYAVESKSLYWIWGIVATVATCAMLVGSGLYTRRWSYEVFLLSHIVMAVFVIVGSWYHVEFLFTRKWGYEFWLYAACAVWFFDRLLRVLRILKNGVRGASVSAVADDIMRIDISGLRWLAAKPGMHTYVYFPSLNRLRPWENHPFSVVPTALLRPSPDTTTTTPPSSEKSSALTPPATTPPTTNTTDITLFIRKNTGLTQHLHTTHTLTALLDGPYSSHSTTSILTSDRLLLLAGGIGITGVLSYSASHTNVKLCWSVRRSAEGLARNVEPALQRVADKDVCVGRRIDIAALLEDEESKGWTKVGVVVCGPPEMCDAVRALVAAKGRGGKMVWVLQVEAFSW